MAEVSKHLSVLLQECLHALNIHSSGIYVDATFGRGGHSRAILDQLDEHGRLIAFDKDHEAIAYAQAHFQDPRFQIIHGSFTQLKTTIESLGLLGQVDGILLDLGVSSPQLDEGERGFSFQQDGPLDMRMDTSQGESAAEWLARAKEADIANVLWQYGEERLSRRIARKICAVRETEALTRTAQLAQLIKSCYPKPKKQQRKPIHPATRSFQAIRIYINEELSDLEQVLADSLAVLKPGGRLAALSFHSLEDRILKQFIREQAQGPQMPSDLPIPESQIERKLKPIGKFSVAQEAELAENPRSRSAKLRVAERLP